MARIKHVVSDDQVAHLWMAQGQSDARNGRNFFFDGDTIYSYGRHFPIARIVTKGTGKAYKQVVYFNPNKYSVTTNRHQSTVRMAIPGYVEVFYTDPKNWPQSYTGYKLHPVEKKNIREGYQQCIEELAKVVARARTGIEWKQRKVLAKVAEANAWMKFAGVRGKPFAVPDMGDIEAKIAREREADSRKRAEVQAIRVDAEQGRERFKAAVLEHGESLIEMWRNGANTLTLPVQKDPPNAFIKKNAQKEDSHRYLINMRIRDLIYDLKDAQGDQRYHGYAGYALLRIKPTADGTHTEIETSMGAEFPYEHGKRAYRMLAALRARGETYQRNGYSIHVGGFVVDSMDAEGIVKAGCHTIQWAEIQAFAEREGWTKS